MFKFANDTKYKKLYNIGIKNIWYKQSYNIGLMHIGYNTSHTNGYINILYIYINAGIILKNKNTGKDTMHNTPIIRRSSVAKSTTEHVCAKYIIN